MANKVDAARSRAGRKGAKVANRWRPGDRKKASKAASRAGKKAARTRKSR